MKRPFVYCAIGTLLASTLSVVFIEYSIVFFLVSIVLVFANALYYYFTTRFIKPLCIFIAMTLVFLSTLITYCVTVKPVLKLENKQVNVTAVVLEPPSYYDEHITYHVRVLEVENINGPQFNTDIIDYSGLNLAQPLDVISTQVAFKETSTSENRSFYYANKVFIHGSISGSLQIVGKKSSLLLSAREYITNFYSNILPTNISAVLSALTIGDKTNLSSSFSDNVRSSGVSHVMVVSGLHLSIICQFLMKAFKKLNLSRKLSAIISIVAIFFVVTLCSFTVSSLRAGFTYLVMLIGIIISRRADAINSLCFSVCVIFILNPFAVANISFQLSFAATLGIILIYPKAIARFKEKIPKRRLYTPLFNLCELLTVNFAATIATIPIGVYHFGELSLISPITNILISYCVTVVLVLALVSVLLSVIPYAKFIYMPLLLCGGIITRYINFVINKLGSLRFASISVNKNSAFIILIIYAVVYALYYYLKRSKEYAYSR